MTRFHPIFFSSVWLLLLSTGPLHAQLAVDDQDQADRQREQQRFAIDQGELRVPTLYEGEIEDVGPQFLLREPPPHQYFRGFFDLQSYHTNNVNLVANNRVASDILVASADFSFLPKPYTVFGGTATPEFSVRVQDFNYGFFGDSGSIANGAPVRDNDFMAVTPSMQSRWERERWSVTTGLRYNHLRSTRGDRGTFYREWVPYWRIAYQFEVDAINARLITQYEGNYRFTRSQDGGGAVSRDFNDRTDQAVAFYLWKPVFDRFLLQPYYRFQYTEFTESSRSRRDQVNSVGVLLGYYVNANFSVRSFIGYDKRSSSPTSVFDYEATTIGGGISANVRF